MFVILPMRTIDGYAVSFVLSSFIFLALAYMILKQKIESRIVYPLIVLAVVLRVAMIPVHPVGSDDYYRYLWDGKVIAHGINPYEYAPSDSSLDSLHSSTIPGRVNFPGMKTLYPPLAETTFYVAYEIGGENYVGVKLLLLAAELATIFGILAILKKTGSPAQNVLLYALCPLPVFQFFIDSHVDAIGIALLVMSIYFYIDKSKTLSYILLGLSLCIKPTALIVIPIMFMNERGTRERLKTILVPTAICVAAYFPFTFSGNPFQALTTFAENWTFNGVVFDILNSFIHDNQKARLICGLLFVAAYTPIVMRRGDALDKIYLSTFLVLIFSPVVHPWYVGWLAVLLPFVPRASGIVYVSLVSLTVFTLITYQSSGVWKDYPAVMFAEYLPVIVLFVLELSGKKFESRMISN